jgi:chromosome segregation ATPase
VKSSESGKQREGDCARLVGENNKLLASLNDYKLRVVNLEANLNSSQQQARILQKEMEIFKENSRRETQFIKEERSELLEKNKRLADRVN